jgi:ATP-dependent helicase/nuclease subunit A
MSDFAGAHPGSDETQRDEACEPGRSVLLQAPAGSGKTSVLAQRLLRLLARVDEPEEILAITFTRRAAAEMRARVLAALRGECAAGAQAQRLHELAQAVNRRSAARGWQLTQDPARLRIQTIDSFNFRLAAQLPLAARAGGPLVIATGARELYRRAARETLLAAEEAGLGAEAALLFERLDNRWANVERLIAQMLAVRGHWLGHVARHDPQALGASIARSLARIVEERLSAACACLGEGLRGELASLPGVGALEPRAACLAGWRRLAELTLTREGEWRQGRGLPRLGEAFRAGPARERLARGIELLAQVPGGRDTLIELAQLPDGISDSDATALAALARVLTFAAAQLLVQFAARGRVDYVHVAASARQALIEEGELTEAGRHTSLAIRHILVDEFQDTSTAQIALLDALTSAWEEGEERSLFLVGDPMQSIYQFREAQVGCFLEVRDQGIGGGRIRLERLALVRNFRSDPRLVDWTNDTFERLFPPRDDVRTSAVAFNRSTAARAAATTGTPGREPAEPPVTLELFPGDRAAETAAVAARVCALRARGPQASIAVLVAARAHATAIVAALEARGVDVIGIDLVPLGAVPIVRDMVALLRALEHLGDRTSWLAVLRAPWCGLSLESLTVLSGRRDPLLVWEALVDPARLAACAAAERARIERVRGILDAALRLRTRLPLAEWLELTWIRLGAPDAYAPAQLPSARAFLHALSERTACGEWPGIGGLEDLLEELYAQPHARTAHPVQVLTIHRAKGLEFDHVLLPALDRDLSRGPEPLLRWLELPRRSLEDSDLLMAPVPAVGTDPAGGLGAYMKRLADVRSANEQVRLLYVAATRARGSLHLSAAPKPAADGTVRPRARTLLAALWPALGAGFLESVSARAPAAPCPEASPCGARPLLRLAGDWLAPALPPGPPVRRVPLDHQTLEPPEFSWVGETARRIGSVVHAALESFAAARELPSPESILERRGAFREQLRRQGVPEADLPGATELVVEALRRTLADGRGRWILDSHHRAAASELALTGIAGGRLTAVVIDRSFIDADGIRWVIDFKTSRHEGGHLESFIARELERYRAQLERYAALARGLGPEPVRAAIYFPLLGQFREL